MKISEFLRYRKQSDTVKMICIFAMAGIASIASMFYHLGKIYQYVQSPVEYRLIGETIITQEHIQAFMEIDGENGVTPSLEIPVTIKYQGKEAMINCTLLSKAYMETVYELPVAGSTKRYYMNEAAFGKLQADLRENGDVFFQQGDVTDDGTEYEVKSLENVKVPEEGEDVEQPVFRSAKLVVVKEGLEQEEPFVCAVENGTRLFKEANSVRVQFQHHDLDGLQVAAFQKMGYGMENEETLTAERYEIKIKMLHIRYGMCLAIACLTTVSMLWHQILKNK